MDLSSPLNSLVPSLDGAVLEVLSRTESALGASHIQRLARRGARSGVHRVLDRQVEHGLILAEPTNLGYVYRLNRDHLLSGAVLSAAKARQDFIERLAAACADLKPDVVSAALFGSTARGDSGPESDVDLVLVVSDQAQDDAWEEQLRHLEGLVLGWTGNRLESLVLTQSHLATVVEAGEPLVTSLRDEAVDLAGRPLASVLQSSRTEMPQ